MSSIIAIKRDRVIRLALALVVAFASVAAFTLAGSLLLPAEANAAAPRVCSTAGEIAIQLSDGSSRCVENSCEGVLGAEGRADECTQSSINSNVSVPDANSGPSGVAVRQPAAPSAPPRAVPEERASTAGLTTIIVWVLLVIGIAALLVVAILVLRGRTSSRMREAAAASKRAAV